MHGQWPRPRRIPNHRWNHYDEMKLMSYSSHLAFFMVLPAVVRGYVTRVECVIDETMEESGLLGQTTAAAAPTALSPLASQLLTVSELDAAAVPGTPTGGPNTIYGALISELNQTYGQLQREEITSSQYLASAQRAQGVLTAPVSPQNPEEEGRHSLAETLLNHFRWSMDGAMLERLLRQLLRSGRTEQELRLEASRRQIAVRYERARGRRIDENVPLSKLVAQSRWLREYTKDSERLGQVLQVLVRCSATRGVLRDTLEACLGPRRRATEPNALRQSLQNRHERQRIARILREGGHSSLVNKLH